MPLYPPQQNLITDCIPVTANYTAKDGDTLLADVTSNSFTIQLPATPTVGERITIYLGSSSSSKSLSIDLNGNNYKGNVPNDQSFVGLKLNSQYGYVSLIYTGAVNGWVDYPSGQVLSYGNFVPGMSLWLNGSLTDNSGNGNNATAVGSRSPAQITGLNGNPVLRWDGTGTQELQVAPFLSGTTAATLYIVFTVSSANNYNLVRTYNLDDYWRFSNDSNGYFGTFLSSRLNAYPSGMPSSSSHLISIHANSSGYEVLLDNVSKGLISGNYYVPGDRFRIGTNDKAFGGDIGTLLAYPFFIDKSSSSHAQNLQVIRSLYPSLSI